jgi:hypothetical protein
MNQINQVIGYFYFNKLIKYNLVIFYPFKTIDEHQVSLTSSYNIPVFDLNENKIQMNMSELQLFGSIDEKKMKVDINNF